MLTRTSSSSRLNNALDSVLLAPGYSYSEESVGTNGIGTAIETRSPTLVTGAEHYADWLGDFACAGVPIIHPISGVLMGALDLTGWHTAGGPMLATLARSATNQIQTRLLEQSGTAQNALLNVYLRVCRRCPQAGVLAIGDDFVLMNQRLRRGLDAADQAALLEHAMDGTAGQAIRRVDVVLPSGVVVRMRRTDDPLSELGPGMAVFQVHREKQSPDAPAASGARSLPDSLPGLAGSSAPWRRCCTEVIECVRNGRWVVVAGEVGSGRRALLKAAFGQQYPGREPRVFAAADLRDDSPGRGALRDEVARQGFNVVIRDLDTLSETEQAVIAAILHGRRGSGWVGATVGSVDENTVDDTPTAAPVMLFEATVDVPALRHRIEDVHDLVPLLIRQVGRGAGPTLSPAAMRQLCKYSWPGNVAQLRQVLRDVVQRQRSGVIDVAQLPPVVRALSRHTLTQLEALERDAIVRSLEDNGGNKKAAASALGISRATIYRKIREFGIDV